MRLLLLARSGLGGSILRFLCNEYPDDIAAVVTVGKDAIYDMAQSHGLPTIVFSDVDDVKNQLAQRNIFPTLGAMVWWPHILKEPLLSFPEQGFINTHPALLPYCRGSMSNFWALVEDVPYGVSIHRVDEEVDHGDILAQARIETGWEDTDETLYHASLRELESLFIKNYPLLRVGNSKSILQDLTKGSCHKSRETTAKTYLNLDDQTTVRKLLNLLRARSYPAAPGCRFEDSGKQYEIRVTIREVHAE